MAAVPSANIDPTKYSRLLAKTLPRSIRSEEEKERTLRVIERLIDKGEDNLTPEEGALLDLLVTLVEKFEEEHYPDREEQLGNTTWYCKGIDGRAESQIKRSLGCAWVKGPHLGDPQRQASN